MLVWADGGDVGTWVGWTHENRPLPLEIMKRSGNGAGFQLLLRHSVVERTISWANNDRQLAKDDECWEETGETLIHVASVNVLSDDSQPNLLPKQFHNAKRLNKTRHFSHAISESKSSHMKSSRVKKLQSRQ